MAFLTPPPRRQLAPPASSDIIGREGLYPAISARPASRAKRKAVRSLPARSIFKLWFPCRTVLALRLWQGPCNGDIACANFSAPAKNRVGRKWRSHHESVDPTVEW